METLFAASFWSDFFHASYLVHIALFFYLLGFAVRDELWLRAIILIGTGFYILYYFFISDQPLWEAIYASLAIGAINIFMIGVIISERTSWTMDEDSLALYRHFPNFTPGQFRRLLKLSTFKKVDRSKKLTEQAKPSEYLYFLVEGKTILQKQKHRFVLDKPHFIGEVAFLTGKKATATARAQPGATYLVWQVDDLHKLMAKSAKFDNALRALFNKDMVDKIALGVGPGHASGRKSVGVAKQKKAIPKLHTANGASDRAANANPGKQIELDEELQLSARIEKLRGIVERPAAASKLAAKAV